MEVPSKHQLGGCVSGHLGFLPSHVNLCVYLSMYVFPCIHMGACITRVHVCQWWWLTGVITIAC